MIEISTEIYHKLALHLLESVADGNYFNGTIEYETEEFYSTLTLTAVIYRREMTLPEGSVRPVSDVVPIWWEFTTVQECGETLNDFSFARLIPYIIEYE